MLHAIAIGLAAIAAATDLKSRRIPNWLTLPVLGTGVAYGLISGGPGGLLTSLAGILVGGGLLLGPAVMGAMGRGDLKFQAAAGALMGPWFAAGSLALAAVLGGLLAAGYVLWAVTRRREPVRAALAGRVPYGPALAFGVVAAIALQALPDGV